MTDTTEPAEVLGRPVTGKIERPTNARVEQKPGEEFLPLLDAVLAVPTVEAVRWTQATPYWNDGEPCLFRINDSYIKIVGQSEGGDEGDGWLDSYDLTHYPNDGRVRVARPGREDVAPAFMMLAGQLDHFEVFLHEAFGDHATVTATREGFDVEFYEHD